MGKRSGEGSSKVADYLKNLFDKRGSAREEVLSSVIGSLTTSCQYQFAEKNFATLLHGCLNCFKKGSSKESCLASHALGLLAITTGCGNNAHELYRECFSTFSQSLKSKSEPSKLIYILDCLAIVTFVCGDSSVETERSLEIIWGFIDSESGSTVGASKHLATVKATAISAWSLVLTTIDGWMLNVKYWERAVSFILDLLEMDDVSIAVAASEALAVIVETGYLEKFVRATKGSNDNSVDKGNSLQNGFSSTEELKGNILSRVRNLFLRAEVEELANKAARENCLKVFEDDCFPQTSVKIGKHKLTLNSWSKMLQMNFLKRLLGAGFVRHMMENELLHGVFDFKPQAQPDKLYVAEREDVIIRRFMPEVRKQDCRDTNGRMTKSPNSVYSKASTQLLNKQRALRDAELRSICEAVDDGSELV
ncbi:hypothetical protein LguiA_027321 [Lonicera macranthoides]